MNFNPRRSWISRFFGASVPAKAPKGKKAIALENLETRLTPASNFYIDPVFGNNANSGTQASPWATLQFAIDNPAVQNGDTLNVGPGVITESGTDWTANGDVVSVLVSKSLTIQGTFADWTPVTDVQDIQGGIELGSQGMNSQALFVIDSPNVTVTGLQIASDYLDTINEVNGQGNLIFITDNNVTLRDLWLNTNRANADTQGVDGTTATAVYFYDPNPTVDGSGNIVSSSISTFLVTENVIDGTILLANGTGYGQPSSGMQITNNEIAKGLYGALYLMGDGNGDPSIFSSYDNGFPTLTNNYIFTWPFAANPTDDAPGNFGAFQSLYYNQANRPALSYLQGALANNTIDNYVAVVTPGGDVRQQGSAATFYGFNVFPYLWALSGNTEAFLNNNEPENAPVQAGDTIQVSAQDIDTSGLNYNLLTANGVTLLVEKAPSTGFDVTLSDYVAPSATSPYSLSMTFSRGALVPSNIDLAVVGNAANNILTGESGNNSFTGGVGNDVIDGIAGVDTVYFSGALVDYSFTYNSATGMLQVTDLRSGSPDGSDQLWNIDFLVFDNGGIPQTIGVAKTGTTIQSIIDDASSPTGVLVLGYHATEDVVVNRDFILTGVADSATGTFPTANSFTLTNNAILGLGSGEVYGATVNVQNGSLITDGVLLTNPDGSSTLNVNAGIYPPTLTDNNVVFYHTMTVNAVGGDVFADAFTLTNGTVLTGGFANFKAASVTVNPGSTIAQGLAMTDLGGTLFLAQGQYNEDVVLSKEVILSTLGTGAIINGSTVSPLVIDNAAVGPVTSFLDGNFSFTSSATTTPEIRVTAGSFLGILRNGATGAAKIVLADGVTTGGNLELYNPVSGGQITMANALTMGLNSSVTAFNDAQPTLTGVVTYTSPGPVTFAALPGATGTGNTILTVSGAVISNGVIPTQVEPGTNQVNIQGALVAALNSQSLNFLNSQSSSSTPLVITVVINTAGTAVDTSTLNSALTAQFADTTPVSGMNIAFTGSTPVSGSANAVIASYTITPTTTWQAIAPGQYQFILSGVKDSESVPNVLTPTLITTVGGDYTQPTATITPDHPDPTNIESTTFTILFSEVVQGLTQSDLVVTGGTISSFTVNLDDPKRYLVTMTANGTGERVQTMTIQIPAGVAVDSFGNPNLAASSGITFDNLRPTPVISYTGPNPTSNATLNFTVTWDEVVTDFLATDINLTNATLAPGSFVQTGPSTYTFSVNPLATGPVTVEIVENIAEDLARNPNNTAVPVTVVYDATNPTVTLSTPLLPGNITRENPVIITFTMSEAVSLRDASLLQVTGGTAGTITPLPGSGDTIWQVEITPTDPNAVTPMSVTAQAGLFKDAANNQSLASAPLNFTYEPKSAVSKGLAWSTNSGNQVVVKKADGTTSTVTVFPGWNGGLRVAQGDVTGDNIDDLVVVPTAGGAPNVVVINGDTLATAASFYAFAAGYKGGLTVAVGDLTGDRVGDIVIGSGGGAQSTVATFQGGTWANLKNFYAYTGYTGQVNVGTVDVDGSGKKDIVTGSGYGTRGHVVVFDYDTLAATANFFAFAAGTTSGAYVAGGNLQPATAADEIAVGSGGNMQSTVNLFSPAGVAGPSIPVFSGFMGAAKVAITDYNGDGITDLAVGAGQGGQPNINIIRGDDLEVIDAFFGYPETWRNGINFGA